METLPKELKPYFWDVNFSKLDVLRNNKFIVERLLEKGRMEQVKWVFQTYKRKRIKEIVNNSPNISDKTRNLWISYFSTYRDEITH